MSHLNSVKVLKDRPLRDGRLETKLSFQEDSPDIPKPPMLFIDPISPAPTKDTNAGCETLADAMACLRGEC